MGQNDSGLRQTPFTEAACPTPEATGGDQGIGGGLEAGPGENGHTAVAWKDAPVPTPTNMTGGGAPFGDPSRFSSIDGGTHKDEHLQGDITMPPKYTVDKR